MNEKIDILNSWIMVEKLSEGSINTNTSLLSLSNIADDWESFFKNFLAKSKQDNKISDKAFSNSGLVIYLDIFNFQEVVDIIRTKYNIQATYEEISNSDKFTFALYFNNNLNFIQDKMFYTISGYIRYNQQIPDNFSKIEEDIRKEFADKFQHDFHQTISEIFDEYDIFSDQTKYSSKNYKTSSKKLLYGFVRNLETDDVNLHSFFIDDLEKSKNINTDNIDRYFSGFFKNNRKNLDSNHNSNNFNPKIFTEILQPKFYPLGRFPSNPKYALSFMQQVAVNLALNDKNNLRSVNGPPGTGKTTLLKDVFAELVVRQAYEICQLKTKSIGGSLVYFKDAKLGILPSNISDKNIVVTSSNNGAVQNIVNELPKIKDIDEEFKTKLLEANYFEEISNSQLSKEWIENKPCIRQKKLEEKENWGVFSLEGGASKNISKLLLHLECIKKYLENTKGNEDTYSDFMKFFEKLNEIRNDMQNYSQKLKEIEILRKKYREESEIFEREKIKNEDKFLKLRKKFITENENSDFLIKKLEKDKIDIDDDVEILNQQYEQAKRDIEMLNLQKPSLFSLQKIFNSRKTTEYLEKLNNANADEKIALNNKKEKLLKLKELKKEIDDLKYKIEKNNKEIEKNKEDFKKWLEQNLNNLETMQKQIDSIVAMKLDKNIKELDLTISYEDLQKSNPWFGEDYRKQQSQLFILALKVKKQFLYENIKNLNAATIIWNRQNEYLGKENGRELIVQSWHWINFAIPIISTTFASFSRMFKNIGLSTIGNLFIDEAGQALPQASVGAIFRSKKVMAVGDPSQIKPVLTLDSNMLNLIARHYKVDEKFIGLNASTQSIIDDAGEYGFQKSENEWIGIPLWVHRRSNYPMFTISNEISYGGLMVQGKPEANAYGLSKWLNKDGNAIGKFVKEQGELLKECIKKRLNDSPELKDDIYVISPFRNVAYELNKMLKSIDFANTKTDKKIGTVHTFQGKEAKIVYFVLGCDKSSQGAAKWAFSEPNMINVAATRAKEEFYIIGDKNLYSSLGSDIANTTIEIIDNYNKP